jgi:hypothetical protein
MLKLVPLVLTGTGVTFGKLTLLDRVCFNDMVSAEDIRNATIALVRQRRQVTLREVAEHLRPEQWQEIIDQVRLVAESLSQEGKLRLTRNGGESFLSGD